MLRNAARVRTPTSRAWTAGCGQAGVSDSALDPVQRCWPKSPCAPLYKGGNWTAACTYGLQREIVQNPPSPPFGKGGNWAAPAHMVCNRILAKIPLALHPAARRTVLPPFPKGDRGGFPVYPRRKPRWLGCELKPRCRIDIWMPTPRRFERGRGATTG
jgi:hypothetical protein